ncbi:MAG: ubiquinol-cytochrome c reductase iron-sulfur subunit [Acidobacteriota bacterium]
MNRRAFYLSVIYSLWSLMGAVVAVLAAIYLLFPPRLRRQEEWVEVGSVGDLRRDSPVEWVFRRNRTDGWKVTSEKTTAWIVKKSDQQVVAFGPQCPHLGCAYHWDSKDQSFLCPCHTSTFSLEGEVLTGPAPRSLDRYDVKIEGGKLYVGSVRKSEERLS